MASNSTGAASSYCQLSHCPLQSYLTKAILQNLCLHTHGVAHLRLYSPQQLWKTINQSHLVAKPTVDSNSGHCNFYKSALDLCGGILDPTVILRGNLVISRSPLPPDLVANITLHTCVACPLPFVVAVEPSLRTSVANRTFGLELLLQVGRDWHYLLFIFIKTNVQDYITLTWIASWRS